MAKVENPRRAGAAMIVTGVLFVALGIVLLVMLPDKVSVHYYGSLHYNGRLLVGLGGLCLFMGFIVFRGASDVGGSAGGS